MRKIFKAISSIVITVAMLSSAMVCLAAEDISFNSFGNYVSTTNTATSKYNVTSIDSNSFPYPSISHMMDIDTSWQTIASSSTGFGCNVEIASYNSSIVGFGVAKTDIRMLGKDEQVLWEGDGEILGDGERRIFICGNDVYYIQLRTQRGKGAAYACKTTQPAN